MSELAILKRGVRVSFGNTRGEFQGRFVKLNGTEYALVQMDDGSLTHVMINGLKVIEKPNEARVKRVMGVSR